MAAATNTAGGKSDSGNKNNVTAAVPPPVQAGSAWPGALRIDVELAETHARKMKAYGRFGRIDEKKRSKAVPTRRPPKHSRQHRHKCSVAEGYGGGDEKTRKVGVAGRRVDVGMAESHARAEGPAVLTTGGIGRLRSLIENRRRSGVTTRSTVRWSIAPGSKILKNVMKDGEDMNRAPSDGVPLMLGSAGGDGANGDKANDARGSVTRILSKVERLDWVDQEGAPMAGVGRADITTGLNIWSVSREGQGRIKRLRDGGVPEGGQEKVRFGLACLVSWQYTDSLFTTRRGP